MATVENIINNAISIGNLKAAQAEAYSGQAYNSANMIAKVTPGRIGKANVSEPRVHIPSRVSGLDMTVYNSMYREIIGDLSDMFADFLREYLPFGTALLNSIEAKLQDMVDGKTGLDPTWEARVWQRDRDRITVEAASATEAAIAQWAARGFPLPPGAANATVQAIERKRSADMAAVSREAAIKAFETSVENVRFALKAAADYRMAALNAAGDYIRALAAAPNIAADVAKSSGDAQARLISAVASYYNARTNAEQLAMESDKFTINHSMDAARYNVDAQRDVMNARVNAATAAAQSLGQQAAAALNAVTAQATKIQAT